MAFYLESLGAHVIAIDHAATNHNGMLGIRHLSRILPSSIQILDVDLDAGGTLPPGPFRMTLALGLLYHLKNPFYFLETVSRISRYCILSTRIARYFPGQSAPIEDTPVAYLVGETELNNDNSNYWIFSRSCLQKLFQRTNWKILNVLCTGDRRASDPVSPEHDERAFYLLQSQWSFSDLTLGVGWHAPEANGWRWTERLFRVTVPPASGTTLFRLELFLPEPLLAHASGKLTLHCLANGTVLRSKLFETAGDHHYAREVPAPLSGEPLLLEFELSCALPPDGVDARERGIIVSRLTAG